MKEIEGSPPGHSTRRIAAVLAGAVLTIAIYVAGGPGLAAPWIQGDERYFISRNSDVTGTGRPEPAPARWAAIFTHVHDDLYQPLPVLSYAMEWALWGDHRTFFIRQTDVLLHAANALLLWAVLVALLKRFTRTSPAVGLLIGWVLAAIWALHPALAASYAADMGRTHVLAATFLLASLLLHMRALAWAKRAPPSGRRAVGWFVAAALAICLANLCKVSPGWAGVVFAIECGWIGWRASLRSPRVYVIALISGGFGWLAYHTSSRAGLIDDAQLALFGDPLTRSLLGVWLYVKHAFFPLDLATWYPPDVETNWLNPRIWAGLLILLAGLAVLGIVILARLPLIGIGMAWFWCTLIPLIGVAGARVAAAQDRYLYVPLMGVAVALGGVFSALQQARLFRSSAVRKPLGAAAFIVALSVCGLMIFADRTLVWNARDTVRRAIGVGSQDPNDPRRIELLALSYDFATSHPETIPPGVDPQAVEAEFLNTLTTAARAAEASPKYFRDPQDRAAFHRRMSWQFLGARRPDLALDQALRAQEIDPDNPLTWTRIAQSSRALGRLEDALSAYQQIERNPPARPRELALRLTELGDLLMRLDRPAEAMARYRKALVTGEAPLATLIGLARCEVLAGQGSEGLRLAQEALRQNTGNVEALKVIAMYRLRSHEFDEAFRAYRQLVAMLPVNYEVLRGFHEACAQLGAWREAAFAWQEALEIEPDNVAFRSFFVWAAACASDEQAAARVEKLLEADADNAFACLAKMIIATRSDRIDEAIAWAQRAERGQPVPEGRELPRAEATLRIMIGAGELPPDAEVVRARLLLALGARKEAELAIQAWQSRRPKSRWHDVSRQLLVDSPMAPASGPTGPPTASQP